ncbi:MAG: Trk system potassium transporter TrkA [Clostridiales Family XIII bacterium]|jgi:trk system potassium uptake protein TrkA|nr:Trk system potassium transporter TrkA [Clostridiales Family XIII bacterium]
MKIAVAGAGKLGVKITEALLGGGHSVTVIDKDEETLQELSADMDIMTAPGNAKQISLLSEINIKTFDCLLATTDSDEKNILIASFAKKLGCGRVIARVRDPEHMRQLDFIKRMFGIDYIVSPDFAITREIYKYLVEKYALNNSIFSTGKIALLEFASDKFPELIGRTVAEAPKLLGNILVAAVSRNGRIIISHGEMQIAAEDVLYVAGEKNLIARLGEKVFEKGKYTDLQRVMIAGGGKTGLYLAKLLSEYGASVKIIEADKRRCQYLSANLDDVLVLHGDATDPKLLEEENFDEMDAFVAATDYDEENLLLALLAKQHEIEDVIAKISRESYAGLIGCMGVDMALNPLNISASHVLRYIQGSDRVIYSQIIQGQAEIIEVIVDDRMMFVNRPLARLELPDGVIIAAIHRGREVIIPDGATEIKEGDRVVIFSLLAGAPDLEKLLRDRRGGLFG